MATAFFDVDGTIVRGATGLLAVDIFRRAGYITYWHSVQALAYHVLHKAGVMHADEAYKKAIAPFVGRRVSEVAGHLERVYRLRVRPAIYDRAVSLAEAHQRRGDRIVLLSASSAVLLEHFRDALPVTDVLAFNQDTRDGVLVDTYAQPVPYGANKLYIASRYLEQHGETFVDATFYTDSITDLPLLERVGVPRPVNPDLRLTRVAEKSGWPILRFYRVIGPQ